MALSMKPNLPIFLPFRHNRLNMESETRERVILSLGDIAWDILFKPKEEIVYGSDVPGIAELLPGGSAANFAVWARRMETKSRLAGKVGDDELGEMMLTHLENERVENAMIVVPGVHTARIGVLVSPRGERAFIMDKDRFLAFHPEDFKPEVLDGCLLLFFTGYTIFTPESLEYVQLMLREARKRKILLAFDPASFHLIEGYGPSRIMEEIGPLDFLLLNEEEARALKPDQPPRSLLAQTRTLVLKRGSAGATVFQADLEISSPAQVVPVVDTTGAGDAFDAAFLVEYLKESNLEDALKRANQLGAFVVSRMGAQPTWPEVGN